MSLAENLIARIRRDGPISVADYMDACLNDPAEGYYATRPRLGAEGDFITAPHVSQIFGELLGLWAVAVWEELGRPPCVRLVEMGPGDGTLISDVLRASAASPGFAAARDTWLVDTSEPLRAAQEARLGRAVASWARDLAEIPVDAPTIILANELLDCLPIHQAVFTPEGWRERRVGLDARGSLAFTLGDDPAKRLGSGAEGEVREWSPALEGLGREIGALVVEAGGAALFIDYGRDEPGPGDTLQALRGHAKEGPLDNPGAADLTAHVDFPAFLAAARDAGARTTAISRQGDFLWSLGIGLRAERLTAARPDQAAVIARQVERLSAPDQMGALFKVAAIHAPGLATPGLAPGGGAP
jgi:SAM-dependent MidA family methyltransferase